MSFNGGALLCSLFLSLTFSPFLSSLFLSLSHAFCLSLSLSLSHAYTHAPFLLFRTHSVSMSLFCLYFARIHDSRPRMRAVAVRVHACARKREHSRERVFEWTILRAFNVFFFFSSTASSLKLDFILFYLFIYFIYFFGFLAHFVYLAC